MPKKPTRSRNKHFAISPEEEKELKRKAELCGLSEAALIRTLLNGYEPRAAPGKEFYDALQPMSELGDRILTLAFQAKLAGIPDADALKQEAERWHRLQADLEERFLRPERSGH